MTRQGRCVLPPDESGRILDRLAGLEKVIPPELVRALMFEAAQRAGIDTDRLSFTGCLHVLQCRLPECDSRTGRSFAEWCELLLWELGREQTEPRRNRINPRVIKQKMSKWPKTRSQHRHPRPLTKTFAQSVVLVN